MHAHAMTVATERRRFLACLSDPSRFSLVTMLAGGPRCVTELASLVGLSQSCTTRHLQALLRESIVVAERRGKRVVYALRREGPGIHPVLSWVCESVDSPGDRTLSPPTRSRRRVLAEALALEPEPAMGVAVEHESGWVEADLPATTSRSPALEAPSDDDRVATTVGDDSLRTRTELDDFLL